MAPLVLAALLLAAPVTQDADPNAAGASGAPARRPLGFKVLTEVDRPLDGLWDLEIPEWPSRRVRLDAVEGAAPGTFAGVDTATGEPILRLERKKEGIGYQGQLLKVFAPCGLETLTVSEFLPLGEAIVLRFETRPPEAACPPIDGGRAGRFYAMSPRGGSVRLRDTTEISSTTVKDTYSIGGDRPNTEVTTSYSLGGVSVEDGSEVRFLQRMKAPLDGAYWFQIEAVVSAEAGVAPPRGFVKSDMLRFVASLTLRRVKPVAP